MRHRLISIAVFILLLLPVLLNVRWHGKVNDRLTVAKGVLDLSGWNYSDDPEIDLAGQWDFRWKEFSDPSTPFSAEADNVYLDFPGLWNNIDYHNETVTGQGYGTLKMILKIPERLVGEPLVFIVPDMYTSFRFYVNGRILCSNGIPGTSKPATSSFYLPQTVKFVPESPTLNLTLHIANFQHWKGGTSRSIKFGTETYMISENYRYLIIEVILFSILIIMSVVQLLTYFFRRKNIEALIFALGCILFAARTSVTDSRLLFLIFPQFSWYVGVQINYISLYLALPLLLLYFTKLFPWKLNDYIVLGTLVTGILLSILTLATPMSVFTKFLKYFQVLMVISASFLIVTLIRAYNLKQKETFITILSMVYLILIGVNDTLHNNGIIDSILMYNFGLSVFCISQLVIQTYRYSQTFSLIEQINSSLWRFVPQEFLDFLGKKDILDAKPGDRVEEDLCVMFIDIRGFTSISESLGLDDNFRFLNNYLEIVAPIIRSEKGFVDKFLGDGILALFPGESDNAIRAAIKICRSLKTFNSDNTDKGIPEISIGIGINRGHLMLGIIGESFRLDTTVISDVVNVASRIENLNKRFNVPVLVSDSVVEKITDKNISFRSLGPVGIRGRKEPIAVNEILGVDSEEITELKLKQLPRFMELQSLTVMNKFQEAEKILQELLSVNPEDKILQYYDNFFRTANK
ncbi:MAG: adenylate/guanylate cyclase domain-containing protein [Spirochaetes bacterium]|nr:adenylate/guanylate cyclase domain-containing protein [Spirochaetota bacterium]